LEFNDMTPLTFTLYCPDDLAMTPVSQQEFADLRESLQKHLAYQIGGLASKVAKAQQKPKFHRTDAPKLVDNYRIAGAKRGENSHVPGMHEIQVGDKVTYWGEEWPVMIVRSFDKEGRTWYLSWTDPVKGRQETWEESKDLVIIEALADVKGQSRPDQHEKAQEATTSVKGMPTCNKTEPEKLVPGDVVVIRGEPYHPHVVEGHKSLSNNYLLSWTNDKGEKKTCVRNEKVLQRIKNAPKTTTPQAVKDSGTKNNEKDNVKDALRVGDRVTCAGLKDKRGLMIVARVACVYDNAVKIEFKSEGKNKTETVAIGPVKKLPPGAAANFFESGDLITWSKKPGVVFRVEYASYSDGLMDVSCASQPVQTADCKDCTKASKPETRPTANKEVIAGGDVVALKTGGVAMTVEEILDRGMPHDGCKVVACYHDRQGTKKRYHFHPDALKMLAKKGEGVDLIKSLLRVGSENPEFSPGTIVTHKDIAYLLVVNGYPEGRYPEGSRIRVAHCDDEGNVHRNYLPVSELRVANPTDEKAA
jgi:uncharacterized protein YodC (DUF2158 family)